MFYRAVTEAKSSPFTAQPREGSVPAFGTCPPVLMGGLAPDRKGIIYFQTHPITDGVSGLPFASLSTTKTDWFEAGKGSSSTGKDFRSCYAALLNLPFDPWGKGQFGSWKAIVYLVLLKACFRAGVSW